MAQDDELDRDRFVEDVRQSFFNLLKPFLKEVWKYIDVMENKEDSERVFAKYFNQSGFLEEFGSV